MIQCKDCFFYVITELKDSSNLSQNIGIIKRCHRYPERYAPLDDYWCGEGKPKDYKLDQNT